VAEALAAEGVVGDRDDLVDGQPDRLDPDPVGVPDQRRAGGEEEAAPGEPVDLVADLLVEGQLEGEQRVTV
jgi:hypothetical protein